MQFLTPWMLWGMAALAAPLLIHFWQRRKVVPRPFGTLKYLRAAAARTSRSARLENLLLLLLRCLLFALIVLAAARPVVSKRALRLLGGGVQRTVVLVLDDSLSMGYRNGERARLDTAREQALRVVDALVDGDEVAVLAADDRARPLVAQPTLDRNVVRHAIEGVQPGQNATDFSAALAAARKLFAASTKPERELYLFTDNQEGGWRFDPAVVFNDAWKKANPSVIVIRPDDEAAANAAVTAVRITSPLVTEGGRVSGAATVSNFSNVPLHDLLQIRMAGQTAASVPVDAAANASADVPFDFQMPPGTGGRIARGEASLQGDNLPADDRFFFTVSIHQTPRVLVVEGQDAGPERVHSGFFLRRALAAGVSTNGEPPPALPVTALDDASLTPYSAVFLADPPRLSDRAAVKLDQFAKAGGTVVLFPGDAADLAGLARLDFLPATPLRVRELPAGRISSQILDPGNPLFANTWGPDTPFPPLPQRKLIEWRGRPAMQVLVLAGGSEAFVLAGDDGAGKVYVVNASPDRAWGDFPLSPAFLPLVQQIALQSSEGGRAPAGITVGQPVPVSPALPVNETLTVGLPDGTTRAVPPGGNGAFLLDRAPLSGFYTLGTSAEPTLLTLAANLDPRESNLTPIAEDALARITPHETITGPDNLRLWLSQSRGMVPLWPWVLLALAAVFALEMILSNRAASRRAQGEATHIKTGRLNRRRAGRPFRAPAEEAAPAEATA